MHIGKTLLRKTTDKGEHSSGQFESQDRSPKELMHTGEVEGGGGLETGTERKRKGGRERERERVSE